jgi:hypothetical protein
MGSQFVHIRKDWVTRTAVIIASGPSLTAEDCELVCQARAADKARVVSVSNAWKLTAGFADVFYAADRRYWKHYLPQMLKAGVPRERMLTCCNVTASLHQIKRMKAANRKGLGTYELHTGGNSGFMGANLAVLYGATRILLLGFDMEDKDDRKHFDGPHPSPLVQAMPFKEWIKRFEDAVPDFKRKGVEVINCSRRTALGCFPRVALAEAL